MNLFSVSLQISYLCNPPQSVSKAPSVNDLEKECANIFRCQKCCQGVASGSAGLCRQLTQLNHLRCPSEIALTHSKLYQWRAAPSEGLNRDTMVKILAGLMKTLLVSFKHKHTVWQVLMLCYLLLCHCSVDMGGTGRKYTAGLFKSVASQLSWRQGIKIQIAFKLH